MGDRVYVESMGTTCYVGGERGIATEVHTVRHRIEGAFVSLDERPVVLYVKLADPVSEHGSWREVVSSREVDRDEFDRIVGLDVLRAELGWKPRGTETA
jgi:hypothetical protein